MDATQQLDRQLTYSDPHPTQRLVPHTALHASISADPSRERALFQHDTTCIVVTSLTAGTQYWTVIAAKPSPPPRQPAIQYWQELSDLLAPPVPPVRTLLDANAFQFVQDVFTRPAEPTPEAIEDYQLYVQHTRPK